MQGRREMNLRSRKIISTDSQKLNMDTNSDKMKSSEGSPSSDKKDSVYPKLGYKHWIFFFVYATCAYMTVVWLDQRLPYPKPDGQYEFFSESRARFDLFQLCNFGPRVSGSEAAEVHAKTLILDKIKEIKNSMHEAHRIDLNVQRPSGCYDLDFLADFTLCYQNVTNIVVRFGPAKVTESAHSVLVSCHFDTVPASAGATDDGVSCAIMLEILRVLSKQPTPTPNDIIFLFNGAEENFLQAAHGFITSHPWRHTIRAFINLEGAGAGGRELLFQAGPGNAWLMKSYLESAPHPHCSVVAMEVFQSGIVPSDTDFRMYRDYGRVPGLDIAYIKNGYVYHTEFDRPEFIPLGSIQRAGENVMETLKALVNSPYLGHPGDYNEGRWVFFDFVGLLNIYYHYNVGVAINWATFTLVIIKVALNFHWRKQEEDLVKLKMKDCGYSPYDFVFSLATVCFASLFVIFVVMMQTVLVTYTGLSMVWYGSPYLIALLYVLPGIAAGLLIHGMSANRFWSKGHPSAVERCHMDATIFLLSILMVFVTYKGYASAFLVLCHVLPPLFRDMLIYFLKGCGKVEASHPSFTYYVHLVVMLPTILLGSYSILLFMEIFIPIMGRSGNAVNPELFIASVASMGSVGFVLFTGSFTYASRRIQYILKCILLLFIYMFLLLLCTRLGEPYVYDPSSPRLRRVHLQHVSRVAYDIDGHLTLNENGIWVASMDYRGSDDLPPQSFIEGSRIPQLIAGSNDTYGNMPYYVPIQAKFPVKGTRWISVPLAPELTQPIGVTLNSKEMIDAGTLNMSFTVTGSDHMCVYLTPNWEWRLNEWSFAKGIKPDHQSYFLYLATANNDVPTWNFWVTFKNRAGKGNAEKPVAQLAVASHILHGEYRASKTLTQTVELINGRRLSTGFALGWWRWAITASGWSTQYIAAYY